MVGCQRFLVYGCGLKQRSQSSIFFVVSDTVTVHCGVHIESSCCSHYLAS